MRARVDPELCVGHGRCYELAPDVFQEDERGHCRIVRETLPTELEEQARLGESNCPESAIHLEQSPSASSGEAVTDAEPGAASSE